MATAYGHYEWEEPEYGGVEILCFICAVKKATEAGEGESIHFKADDEEAYYACGICGMSIKDRVGI